MQFHEKYLAVCYFKILIFQLSQKVATLFENLRVCNKSQFSNPSPFEVSLLFKFFLNCLG